MYYFWLLLPSFPLKTVLGYGSTVHARLRIRFRVCAVWGIVSTFHRADRTLKTNRTATNPTEPSRTIARSFSFFIS